VVDALLAHHAYIDAESPNGTTPLMMAAQYGVESVVVSLLEAGADASLRNEQGLSALDFARRADRPDIVLRLERAYP
jgi:ankyrin repeat protein